MQAGAKRTSEPNDVRIVRIFPGRSSSTKLYDDNGDGLGYQHDEFAWTSISASNDGRSTTVLLSAAQGSYPGMLAERAYRIELAQTFPPESVTVNGHAVPYATCSECAPRWHYDGATLTTVITLPKLNLREQLRVNVQIGAEQAANQQLLTATAGRFARLRRAMDIINSDAYPQWSPDSLIDAVQTSRRIELQPASALNELRRFWNEQENVLHDMRNLSTDAAVIDRALMQVTSSVIRKTAKAAAAE
jgi:alpha-glucosidase